MMTAEDWEHYMPVCVRKVGKQGALGFFWCDTTEHEDATLDVLNSKIREHNDNWEAVDAPGGVSARWSVDEIAEWVGRMVQALPDSWPDPVKDQ